MARVELAGIGQDSQTPIGAVFSEHGIILPPYSDVGGYGPTNAPAEEVALYTPSAGYRFEVQLAVISCDGAQTFTFTCGAWQMTLYVSNQGGETIVIPFVNGGLRLPVEPLTLTTPNAVNHYVGFMGRQVHD
jgi:hypothetical protein